MIDRVITIRDGTLSGAPTSGKREQISKLMGVLVGPPQAGEFPHLMQFVSCCHGCGLPQVVHMYLGVPRDP